MKTPENKRKKKNKKTQPEDVALWAAVRATVEPLKNRECPPEDLTPKTCGPIAAPVHRVILPHVAKPLAELSHDHQPGLDKATAKRLRRGRARIEGRLDLHGMTQAEARPALENFIEAAWRASKREVLVITGKGTRADGAIGVLRSRTPLWLNAAPNRARITAFTYAAPKDGGEGALYVRLKKQPKSL